MPDEVFDYYKELFTQPKRRNTEPPPPSNMTRDSMSSYNARPRRTSSYSITHFTPSRARDSRAVWSPPPLDEGYASQTGRSDYAVSNVTGYRRTLDVPGMPQQDYFTSGESQWNRRPEYTRRAPSIPKENSVHSRTTSIYGSGKELVPYTGGNQRTNIEEDSDSDLDTLGPKDSISNVSTQVPGRRSRTSRRPPNYPSQRSYQYQREYAPPVSCRRSYSYAEGVGGTLYGEMPQYGSVGGYRTEERRPVGY